MFKILKTSNLTQLELHVNEMLDRGAEPLGSITAYTKHTGRVPWNRFAQALTIRSDVKNYDAVVAMADYLNTVSTHPVKRGGFIRGTQRDLNAWLAPRMYEDEDEDDELTNETKQLRGRRRDFVVPSVPVSGLCSDPDVQMILACGLSLWLLDSGSGVTVLSRPNKGNIVVDSELGFLDRFCFEGEGK